MSAKIFLAALAASAAVARPLSDPPGLTSYNANFDNLAITPSAIVPVGQYDGLNWTGFFVDTTFSSGVQPHSRPNAAVYDLQGFPSTVGNATITPETEGATFTLENFYFGCDVYSGSETVGNLPAPCKLTVTGFVGDVAVATQTFDFHPLGNPFAPQEFFEFSAPFAALTSAQFFTVADVPGEPIGTLVDNVVYTVENAA